MQTIVILNHTNHECYIENVNENILESKYDSDIQKYIEDSYNLEGVDYTWDCVNEVLDYSNENEYVEVEQIY